MRLDFNVLWIDDQPENIQSFQERFAYHTMQEGFRLKIQPALSLEDAKPLFGNSVFLDNIDLVVVDYNLGDDNTKGDAAVEEIRRTIAYRDIVFYSAEPLADLTSLILAKGVEGVYCAHRPDLTDTLKGVFDSLVKKVLDIDHCRGIVMGVTSDIDGIVLDCLVKLETELDEQHKPAAFDYAIKKIDKNLEEFQSVRSQLTSTQSLSDLIKAHKVFTASDRLGLLKKILTLHHPNAHTDIRRMVGDYNDKIPRKRNRLGHQRLVAIDGVRTMFSTEGQPISEEEMRTWRQLLIRFRDDFDRLAEIVGLTTDDTAQPETNFLENQT